MIRILYFGQCEEAAASREEELEFVGSTDELRVLLESRYSGLKKIDWQLAVNQTLGTKDIQSGDEIALLPPFAGG